MADKKLLGWETVNNKSQNKKEYSIYSTEGRRRERGEGSEEEGNRGRERERGKGRGSLRNSQK